MNFFNFNFKKAAIIIFIALLPLLSINMEQKSTQTTWFAQPISYVSGITQSFFAGITQGVRRVVSEYINIIGVKSENKIMKEQIQELQAIQAQFEENLIENNRLKKLLEFKSKTKMKLLPAQVIGKDLTVDHQTITINKGTAEGVKDQQAVLTTEGAVGYIQRPQLHSSQVMLTTDRYAVTDAILQKSRSRAIIEGMGKDNGLLKYVDRDEKIEVGDIIVTGGLDNIYPIGFPLATVKEVMKKSNSSIRVIHTAPVVHAEKIEEVFVILSTEGEDFSSQSESNQ